MKEWDDDGNLIHFKDGDFEYTSEFDKSNNEIKRLYADSADSTFEYNENEFCSMYVNGELKKITDKNGTLRYEINSSGSQNWYDEKCRLIKHD